MRTVAGFGLGRLLDERWSRAPELLAGVGAAGAMAIDWPVWARRDETVDDAM